MKRKGVLLFFFCFLGVLGCVEYEEKIEVKREGGVKLTASVMVNLEEFVKVMEKFSGKEMGKEEVLREIEESKKEVKEKVKKIQEIKGVDKVVVRSKVDEKSLKNTFVVMWKSLEDFQKSFVEVQDKLFDLEAKQKGERRIQFSLSKKGETYLFSLVFRKKAKKQEKADPMVDMMASFLLGDFTFRFKAPVILETNGKLNPKEGEVFWRFPVLSLAKGTKDIKIEVKFRLKE